MKILFSGGGTLGPVTPLIAIINEIKKNHPEDEVFWVSTKNGVENKFLNDLGIKTYPIYSAKLRRYFSWKNFKDILNFKFALLDSYRIIKKLNPDVIVSAGGFVSVPLIWMAKLLRKKILIHQQDLQIGLANKLMKPFADKITVSFNKQLDNFPKDKVVLTGNPCRFKKENIDKLNKLEIIEKYNFNPERKVILFLGGGTGSEDLNNFVSNNIDKILNKADIIHVTGKGKAFDLKKNGYYQYEFIDKEMLEFLFLADLIVSRAGLGTFTEFAFLGKAVILFPLQGHQEVNANYFYEKKVVELASVDNLIDKIDELLDNESRLKVLQENIANFMLADGEKNILKEIYLLNK